MIEEIAEHMARAQAAQTARLQFTRGHLPEWSEIFARHRHEMATDLGVENPESARNTVS